MLTRRPVGGHTGTTLLVVVGAFGVATIVFGLSKSLPLSVVALAVAGFVDMVSVNIRSTIAVVAAPNELRGRVTAVESVFISASNELGAFESGRRGHAARRGARGRRRRSDHDRARARAGAGSSPTSRRSTGSTSSGRNPLCRVGPMATIRIPPILRPEAGGNRQVDAEGATVREVLENLVATYPSLRARVFEGDDLPQFLNVFIDQDDIRLLDGLDTPVPERGNRDPAARRRGRVTVAVIRRPRYSLSLVRSSPTGRGQRGHKTLIAA